MPVATGRAASRCSAADQLAVPPGSGSRRQCFSRYWFGPIWDRWHACSRCSVYHCSQVRAATDVELTALAHRLSTGFRSACARLCGSSVTFLCRRASLGHLHPLGQAGFIFLNTQETTGPHADLPAYFAFYTFRNTQTLPSPSRARAAARQPIVDIFAARPGNDGERPWPSPEADQACKG